jgi:hypothetical protein
MMIRLQINPEGSLSAKGMAGGLICFVMIKQKNDMWL